MQWTERSKTAEVGTDESQQGKENFPDPLVVHGNSVVGNRHHMHGLRPGALRTGSGLGVGSGVHPELAKEVAEHLAIDPEDRPGLGEVPR